METNEKGERIDTVNLEVIKAIETSLGSEIPWVKLIDGALGPDVVVSRVHDWRNYVEAFEDCWHLLRMETRAAIYLMAEARADIEEWD